MNLITDKACFNISLRNACLGIAIFFLVSLLLGVVIRPSYLSHSSSLVGFIIEIIGNVCLLFGALLYNKWLVLAWLVQAILFFVGWPIAFFGVIFNYGGYRYASMFDNIFLVLLEYIVALLLFAYCARLVYSFFHQLKNSQGNPTHTVVI